MVDCSSVRTIVSPQGFLASEAYSEFRTTTAVFVARSAVTALMPAVASYPDTSANAGIEFTARRAAGDGGDSCPREAARREVERFPARARGHRERPRPRPRSK